jgi:hypothetical protein
MVRLSWIDYTPRYSSNPRLPTALIGYWVCHDPNIKVPCVVMEDESAELKQSVKEEGRLSILYLIEQYEDPREHPERRPRPPRRRGR